MIRKQRAFTLVELMIVVVIIGALAAMVLPKLTGYTTKAKIKIAKGEIRGIETALKLYEAENGVLPTTGQGLQALMIKPTISPVPNDWDGPYLEKDPEDPWDNPYQYRCPPQHHIDFDLWSYGPDGKDGTDDDITNWKK